MVREGCEEKSELASYHDISFRKTTPFQVPEKTETKKSSSNIVKNYNQGFKYQKKLLTGWIH